MNEKDRFLLAYKEVMAELPEDFDVADIEPAVKARMEELETEEPEEE